jgi:hypothetical protein
MHVYEVRPRKDKRGFDLISDVLPFGRLWYAELNAISNAIAYAHFYTRCSRASLFIGVAEVRTEHASWNGVSRGHKHSAVDPKKIP